MKWVRKLAIFKIRMDRGNALIQWVKNIIIIVAGIKIIFEWLNTAELTILAILSLIMLYFIGWLDLEKIKLYPEEQSLITKEYNPHLRNIAKINGTSKLQKRS